MMKKKTKLLASSVLQFQSKPHLEEQVCWGTRQRSDWCNVDGGNDARSWLAQPWQKRLWSTLWNQIICHRDGKWRWLASFQTRTNPLQDVKLLEQVDWNGSKNWTNIFTSLFCWRSFSNLHLLYCPPDFDWVFWVQICLHQSLLGYCINLRSLVSLFLEHLSWSELGGGVGNSMNPKVVLRNSFWNVWEDPFDYILPDILNYSKKFSLRYLSLELCTFIFDDFVSDSLSW